MVVCLNGQYLIMSDTSCVIHFVSPNSLSLSVTNLVCHQRISIMVPTNLYMCYLIGNFTLCVIKHAVKANAKNAP